MAAAAAACLLLAACGNGLREETAEAEYPSGCASGQLGCATSHNIATAAARPSDLVQPRREQPRDYRRREAAIAAYRQGDTRIQTAGPAATPIVLQEGKGR
jgi:type IV pilus biogenesis protein CpaD/CtpE